MFSTLCSQGHVNPPDSRFCRLCGEKLATENANGENANGENANSETVNNGSPAPPKQPLVGLRYRMVRQLGIGGFGRTYLAEDVQRFNELCVLKEFAPQVEGTESIRKAEDLFEREAGVLYRLRHAQIPRFRELLRAEFEGRDRLFLVQDYIAGPTYQELLDRRTEKGKAFAEPEIMQFLSQILPVLDYIHKLGVIHRDIAPDNLIRRDDDDMPVLIDFGGVKQAAVTVVSELGRRRPTPEVTLVGKRGYAPHEQMQDGQVKPHSDFYALAMTVLVLMTGEAPGDLLNTNSVAHWEKQVQVSPVLRSVLQRMLDPRPEHRYPTARDVMHALGMLRVAPNSVANSVAAAPAAAPPPPSPPPPAPAAPPASSMRTVAVSPAAPRAAASRAAASRAAAPRAAVPVIPAPSPAPRPSVPTAAIAPPKSGNPLQGVLAFFMIVALAGLGGWIGYRWIPEWLNLGGDSDTVEQSEAGGGDLDTPSSEFSSAEQERKEALRSRRDDLGIDTSFLVALTDALFYRDYPRQQGRELTDSPTDAEWRARWDAIATDWLDTLDDLLSAEARRRLGDYGQGDRERWRQAVNRLHVSSDALYDLTDAKFFRFFPNLRGQEFLNQPVGQIWHAIAADQVRAMQAGKVLEDVRFGRGSTEEELTARLGPGEGKVYTLNLSEGQIMEVDLEAPNQALLSIYVPRPNDEVPYLLEDTQSRSWSGTLPQSGYYEVAIVSMADSPIDYRLSINVETPDS